MKFLIVGAGFYGSVCARELTDKGHTCLVVDKRNHIAGNAYTSENEGIHVHQYGPHIFHTNNLNIWQWVNRFAAFNNFQLNPVANYKGQIYSLPFNMWTFNQMWGVGTPEEAKNIIDQQKYNGEIKNLEDQALSLVGIDIYNKLIKGYTKKQWGMHPRDLPSFIIKRLPVRFTYDNNYYYDRYQGIPIGGYTQMFKNILSGIDVKLQTDFFSLPQSFLDNFDKIIYTGPIDLYYNYKYGDLEYRSLRWYNEYLDTENLQGCAIMNYTDSKTPHTRSIEHKYFDYQNQKKTIVSYEFPETYKRGMEAFYPINNKQNQDIYMLYKEKTKQEKRVIFGGRLAEYKYYDMHQVIGAAINKIKEF